MKSGKQSANRKAERKWRASKLELDLIAFRAKRNAVTWLMNNAREEFYTNFINENSSDQKKLFNASKRLFNRTRDDGLPPNVDSVAFACDIGKFFVQKIINIRRSLDDSASLHQETIDLPLLDAALPVVEESVSLFSKFVKLSDHDVKLLMSSSSLKTCPLDLMPSILVNQCDTLLLVLTRIINSLLQSGHFPKAWKEALVFPLLKKLGMDFIFENFRPVSNLPFVSKLTERAAFNQTHVHMSTNNLYPCAQSSYRKNHSRDCAAQSEE